MRYSEFAATCREEFTSYIPNKFMGQELECHYKVLDNGMKVFAVSLLGAHRRKVMDISLKDMYERYHELKDYIETMQDAASWCLLEAMRFNRGAGG